MSLIEQTPFFFPAAARNPFQTPLRKQVRAERRCRHFVTRYGTTSLQAIGSSAPRRRWNHFDDFF
jgi:hypothetical protein